MRVASLIAPVAQPLACAIVAAGAASGVLVPPVRAQTGPVATTFVPLSGAALAGTATLTSQGTGSTRIHVQLTPAGGDHPMHLHEGTCANANPAPWYALTNVQGGVSTTDVRLSLDELQRAPKSILVHQSAQALDTVVACAEVPMPAGTGPGTAAQVAGAQLDAAGGVAVLPTGGEPALSLRPLVAFALGALGMLGLFYVHYAQRGSAR